MTIFNQIKYTKIWLLITTLFLTSCYCQPNKYLMPEGYKRATNFDLKNMTAVHYCQQGHFIKISLTNTSPHGVCVPMVDRLPNLTYYFKKGSNEISATHKEQWRLKMHAVYIPWYLPIPSEKTIHFHIKTEDLVSQCGSSVDYFFLSNNNNLLISFDSLLPIELASQAPVESPLSQK